jgi:TP53 regulating kinase and related kinases
MKIIYTGAEAILYLEKGNLVKERIKKSYRHPDIDLKKRKYPTRRENKLLTKAKKVQINVPDVLEVDEKNTKIVMEYIKGDVLKNTLDNYTKEKRKKVSKQIGEQTALMHDHDIIHNDLTTSNMILKGEKVYFIDFGLGFISNKTEDKAVDIHLIKQAFESKHYLNYEEILKAFLQGYKKSKYYKETLERLEKVEKRGRYKRKNSN